MKFPKPNILSAFLISALVLAAAFAWLSEKVGVAPALAVFTAVSLSLAPRPSHILGAVATAERDTEKRAGEFLTLPLAADTVIYGGTLVAKDANGRLVPASDTAGLRVIGRAAATVDNTDGSAGDLDGTVELGVFFFDNSETNAVDAADVGTMAEVEDDQTVADDSTNHVAAGRVVEVTAEGVWVDTRYAYFGAKTVVALTSTNGTAAAAAADLAGLAAEAEKIGDDVRALHASLFG